MLDTDRRNYNELFPVPDQCKDEMESHEMQVRDESVFAPALPTSLAKAPPVHDLWT